MRRRPAYSSAVSPNEPRRRARIEERAARRERMSAPGRDRFSSLMRALQAGKEVPVRAPGRAAPIEWNPIGWTLLKLAAVVVVAWFGVSVVMGWMRDSRTDTWSGPDQSVQSGEKLASCSEVENVRDEAFPSWIRYNGATYKLTTSAWPFIGPGITAGYHDSGYALGALHLILIDNSPEGRKLDTIMLWIDSGIAGREMARVTDC
jgi:hypothetical protein